MAQGTGAALSASVAAAQEQLQQRRLQRRQERLEQQLPVLTDARGRLTSPSPFSHDDNRVPFEPDTTRTACSATVGWESEALSRALRRARQQREAAAKLRTGADLALLSCALPAASTGSESEASESEAEVTARGSTAPQVPPTVLVYPDVAIAMLREGLEAAGRIWFLLRHLDTEGRGWITVSAAREQLAGKGSPLHVCGWRQLRNLLAQGEGLFWQRDDLPASEARLWLRSTARVAAALGVPRLNARAISLDVCTLLASIGTVRAHFYASYHSGRRSKRPISRKCLEELTGVSRRSQQSYEAEAGIERRHNWAVGDQYTPEAAQERAWQQGNGVFQLTDHKGKTGAAGATYVAWQLPNSYEGPHKQQANGSRKRINRQLVDLFTKGITGNGKEKVEKQGNSYPVPRFYEHGQAAARAYNRSAQNDLYWQSQAMLGEHRVWHILPGRETGS